MGSRIAGPVSAKLRDAPSLGIPGGRWSKILALAPKVSHSNSLLMRASADLTLRYCNMYTISSACKMARTFMLDLTYSSRRMIHPPNTSNPPDWTRKRYSQLMYCATGPTPSSA
jgi:hypothetical protein